jgi:Protein of unknown function (DUF3102)
MAENQSIVDPPAIVRPDIDVDTLLRDAKMFGRQTLDAAIKTGELLKQAKEACPHGQWTQKVTKAGFSERTARRLISLYEKSLSKTANLADLTGTSDDSDSETTKPAIGPTTYAGPPILCRPCRVGTPKPNCKACKSLRNAQPKLFEPAPEAPKSEPTGDAAEEAPPDVLTDAEGLVLPERVKPYLEDRSIDDWIAKHGRPAFEAMKELRERPGACHADLDVLLKKQSAVSRMLKSAKLTHRCPQCAGEGCKTCANAGLLSKALWSEK